MSNTFCIHGHFYQPPREDPITGDIPLEPGAAPFNNWNERIHEQCYKPNAELGNFEQISFNIGPTLAQWMKKSAPEVFNKIVAADQHNWKRNGVGNAIAQSYSHSILPLALLEDKITQVRWGIKSFETDFGHSPCGMWLPETAVDMETLEVLAQQGIEFTILAPWQAETGKLDVTKPYLVRLAGGRSITVFFYHEDLSMRVSFEPEVSVNGDRFGREILLPRYRKSHKSGESPEMLLIASDGELYGHHQPFRDKFLEYVVSGALQKMGLEPTYLGLWLRNNPAKEEIKIRPNTSWSCHHGIMRWSGVCDCTPNAGWKKPLRQAFDEIAGMIDLLFKNHIGRYVENAWALRHDYASVMEGQLSIREYIFSKVDKPLREEEIQMIRYLLAAQFERQRMFTSCGWFFDDFDRIEPRNNIAYAAQAVWLVNEAIGIDLSEQATTALKPVVSWRSGLSADVVFNHHLNRARSMKHLADHPQNGLAEKS